MVVNAQSEENSASKLEIRLSTSGSSLTPWMFMLLYLVLNY